MRVVDVSMSKQDDATRRTVLKFLGVTASVGAVGAGHAGARMLDGAPNSTDVSTESSLALDDVAVSEEWPQVQGNAAKTGVASSGPRSNVGVAWQFGADDEQSYGDPVVADGAVYATTEEGLVSLTTEGEFRWFADAAGDEEFRYSAPAVDGDTVYVAAKAAETDCNEKTGSALVALDVEDGTEQGRTPLDGGNDSYQSLTVDDGMVYAFGTETMTDGGTLLAIDTASGEEQWRFGVEGSGIASLNSSPAAVSDGAVYLASDRLYALDAETGEEQWVAETSALKSMQEATPTVVGDTVYVGAGRYEDTVYAVDTEDGSIRWENQPDGPGYGVGYWTSAAVAGDYVVFGFQPVEEGRTRGHYAFDREDGSVAWNVTGTVVAPAATEDLVYTGRKALNAADGSVAWEFGDDVPFGTTAPAVVDDTVYVGGASLTAITGDTV